MAKSIYNAQFNCVFYLPYSYVKANLTTTFKQCQEKQIKVINLVIDTFDEIGHIQQIIKELKHHQLEVMVSFKFISNDTLNDCNWNGLVIFKMCHAKILELILSFVKQADQVIYSKDLVVQLAKYDYLLIPFFPIQDVNQINKQDLFVDINNGVYVEVANLVKHMVFKAVGNIFKKQQDVLGMINEMMYPYIPVVKEEPHYLLHKLISIFSYIFNQTDYFANLIQFKRFANVMGVFQGFQNYLKTPFHTEFLSLVKVSFLYPNFVSFKFNMNIDLNLYYANVYKDSPVYRIRAKILKKFQWWANDKNMWVVIAFAFFFYINTIIAFFTNWAHKGASSGDLAFIATYYANTVTIFNTYFVFGYFSSIFTFIYNYITIKRLMNIVVTKNLKFDVNTKDMDLKYLIKMTNGYFVALGLEEYLITIGGDQPLSLEQYKNQAPFFKYSYFAHQRQLINVFVVRMIILGCLTLITWAITSAFGQVLKDYDQSVWWVIGCSIMLLINFAWSGLNVLDTLIPNPTNWITFKTITAYQPIKVTFDGQTMVLKDQNNKILLDTSHLKNYQIRLKMAHLFTNHVYSAKSYFVILDEAQLLQIANYMYDHKIKMYINYSFQEYLIQNDQAKSDVYLANHNIDLQTYLDKEMLKDQMTSDANS